MIILRIIAGTVYIVLAIAGIWVLAHPKQEEKPELEYSYSLHRRIQKIAQIDEEIQLIIDMKVNLNTADHPIEGDALRSMEIMWDWGGKLSQQTSMPIAKGTATADAMCVVAEVRKEELIRQLSSELRQLPFSEES